MGEHSKEVLRLLAETQVAYLAARLGSEKFSWGLRLDGSSHPLRTTLLSKLPSLSAPSRASLPDLRDLCLVLHGMLRNDAIPPSDEHVSAAPVDEQQLLSMRVRVAPGLVLRIHESFSDSLSVWRSLAFLRQRDTGTAQNCNAVRAEVVAFAREHGARPWLQSLLPSLMAPDVSHSIVATLRRWELSGSPSKPELAVFLVAAMLYRRKIVVYSPQDGPVLDLSHPATIASYRRAMSTSGDRQLLELGPHVWYMALLSDGNVVMPMVESQVQHCVVELVNAQRSVAGRRD